MNETQINLLNKSNIFKTKLDNFKENLVNLNFIEIEKILQEKKLHYNDFFNIEEKNNIEIFNIIKNNYYNVFFSGLDLFYNQKDSKPIEFQKILDLLVDYFQTKDDFLSNQIKSNYLIQTNNTVKAFDLIKFHFDKNNPIYKKNINKYLFDIDYFDLMAKDILNSILYSNNFNFAKSVIDFFNSENNNYYLNFKYENWIEILLNIFTNGNGNKSINSESLIYFYDIFNKKIKADFQNQEQFYFLILKNFINKDISEIYQNKEIYDYIEHIFKDFKIHFNINHIEEMLLIIYNHYYLIISDSKKINSNLKNQINIVNQKYINSKLNNINEIMLSIINSLLKKSNLEKIITFLNLYNIKNKEFEKIHEFFLITNETEKINFVKKLKLIKKI